MNNYKAATIKVKQSDNSINCIISEKILLTQMEMMLWTHRVEMMLKPWWWALPVSVCHSKPSRSWKSFAGLTLWILSWSDHLQLVLATCNAAISPASSEWDGIHSQVWHQIRPIHWLTLTLLKRDEWVMVWGLSCLPALFLPGASVTLMAVQQWRAITSYIVKTHNIVRVDPATAEWLWLWGRFFFGITLPTAKS